MQTKTTSREYEPIIQKRHGGAKPFTETEQRARENGLRWLHSAKLYVRRGDRENAVSCCLEGLRLTLGISRPLAVRDQLHDVLEAIDPTRETAKLIQSRAAFSARIVVHSPQGCTPIAMSGSWSRMNQSHKQCEGSPVIFAPQAIPWNDVHEPAVVLTHRDTGTRQGLLVFEDSDQFHHFVSELVQIHSQWAAHCPFVPDPNCPCGRTSKL